MTRVISILLVVILCYGVVQFLRLAIDKREQRVSAAEHDLVGTLERCVREGRRETSQSWLTNWSQILPYVDTNWLAGQELRFRSFGKRAGFTASLLEKYVFVAPGVYGPVGPRDSRGQLTQRPVLLMSAQPLWSRNRPPFRYVICLDESDVKWGTLSEEEVQKAFARVGRDIPQPEPMPPLNPPGALPPSQVPPLDRQTLREMLKERGYGPVAILWAVYWPWSGVGVAATSIVGLILIVRFLDRRRRT